MGEILLDLEEKEIIEGEEPVNIKVLTTTNEPLMYKILVGKDGIWETLSDFNERREIMWTPKEKGTYMIIAQAKKESSKKPFDYKTTQSIIVGENDCKLINGLYLDKETLKIGEKITLEVDSSVAPLMYRYFISGKNGWQIIKDYSVDNQLTYTVNTGGKFEFLVECKTPDSPNSFDEYKTIGFQVTEFKKPEITDFKCLTDELLVRSDLTFEVKGSFDDERTALYKFVKIDPDGKTYCIQDYSSRRMVSFTEKQPGSYKLLCLIRDMYSSTEYDDRAVMVYEVKPYKEVNVKGFTADLASPQVVGSEILLKAMVEGGNELLYRYKIDGNNSVDSGYIRSPHFLWHAKGKGDYIVTLLVKDESFEGDYEQEVSFQYSIEEKRTKPIRITDVIFDKEKDYLINDPIKITVLTDGSSTLKYSFVISKDGKEKESITYGDSNWVEFIPEEKGEYQLEIKVKDKYSEKEYDTHTVLYFKAKEYIEGKIDHILVPSKGYFLVGDEVDVEVICQNTKDTLIKYVTKINDQVVEETEYINSKKMNIVPKCAGKYIVEMFVKSVKCQKGFDSKRDVKFYVNDALPVTNTKISTNKTTYKVNEEISFIASSEGGTKVCYEYYIMINGNWTLMQKYSRKNYYTFRPFTTGTYRVLVLAKSHYKKCAYEDYDNFEFKVGK